MRRPPLVASGSRPSLPSRVPLAADAAAGERLVPRALERADRYSAAGDRLTRFAGDTPVAVLVTEYLR